MTLNERAALLQSTRLSEQPVSSHAGRLGLRRRSEQARSPSYLKGDTQHPVPLEFVRIEPYVLPKRNLTGSSIERVDTRVLQVIYKFANDAQRRIYVGQQMDLSIEE